MTYRRFALFLALAIGLGAAQDKTTSGQTSKTATPNPFLRMFGNGQWWAGLSDDTKDTFLDGYTAAMARSYSYTHKYCMDAVKGLKSGSQFDTQVEGMGSLCTLAEFFNYDVGQRKLMSEVSEFYKDQENVPIPIEYALQFCRDKLKGDRTPNEMNDELKEWRRIMSNPSKK